ncbi:MAG: hypothetical protein KatS3mg014_1052 [Actinomycetota bacterium]|nr:MAG: hypothetical protein KatS3mg014_1052 [Actinomycetota bacterium]
MRAIAETSDGVEVEMLDVREDPEAAARYGAVGVPTLVLLRSDGSDPGIGFSGIPAGFELATLVQAIALLGSGDPGLEVRSREALARLDRDVTIRVFVTPACPYRLGAARTAMRMAMASERVRAQIIEAQGFPELADAYRVYGLSSTIAWRSRGRCRSRASSTRCSTPSPRTMRPPGEGALRAPLRWSRRARRARWSDEPRRLGLTGQLLRAGPPVG